jgi:hypothetical protein
VAYERARSLAVRGAGQVAEVQIGDASRLVAADALADLVLRADEDELFGPGEILPVEHRAIRRHLAVAPHLSYRSGPGRRLVAGDADSHGAPDDPRWWAARLSGGRVERRLDVVSDGLGSGVGEDGARRAPAAEMEHLETESGEHHRRSRRVGEINRAVVAHGATGHVGRFPVEQRQEDVDIP